MAEELARAVAFMRALDRARTSRIERTRFGETLLTETLPQVWYLNFLSVDPGVSASAAELADDAEAAQGRARLRHRKIAVDDESLGEAVAPGFRELGWTVEPLVVMTLAGGDREARPVDVRQVAREALEPLWLQGMREAGMGEDEARQVVAAKTVNEHASRVDYFAAIVDGRPASYCELYSRDGAGQIEAVLTLPAHRGHGLASAVVLHAVAESRAAGNALTFLVAEEDDWPKQLYARLGFQPVGRVWDFLLRPRVETRAS